MQTSIRDQCSQSSRLFKSAPELQRSEVEYHWFAVFTLPQHEKAALRQLEMRTIETFLPTFESVRVWKNRQRVKIVLPLFPSYLFVRISPRERGRVLQAPGVISIVGNSREPVPVASSEIEFLQSDLCRSKAQPCPELVVGQKVRIRRGSMQGIEGVLVRKANGLRFVLNLELINQRAAVEVNGADVELVA